MKTSAKTKRYSHLFLHILAGIALPLLILLGTFTFLILRVQYTSNERYLELQSETKLLMLKKEMSALFEEPNILRSPEILKKQIRNYQKKLNILKIDVVDPVRGKSYTKSHDPRNEKIDLKNILTETTEDSDQIFGEISDAEYDRLQKSLHLKREGKEYYTAEDKKTQRYRGYIPYWIKNLRRTVIVTAELPAVTLKSVIKETAFIGLIIILFVILTTVLISIILTRRIVHPIRKINAACHKILGGQLGLEVEVKTGNEIEEMADSFNLMSKVLFNVQRQAVSSNPLTKLPGNPVIMKEINQRLQTNQRFVFFHADIDYFKAYNDAYGLEKGDQVLIETGEIFKKIVEGTANPENFLGHQGGDDFVLVLNPREAASIGQSICDAFDSMVKKYYTEEDLKRGYFFAENTRVSGLSEDLESKKFPLMSISLAGISTIKRVYENSEALMADAVSVKKKAKRLPYSYFLIEE